MKTDTRRQEKAEALLRCYKRWISPAFGNSCRFTPTCSEYAAQALAEHGWMRGGMLALWRLLRCHPLAAAGFDPVPPKSTENSVSGFEFQVSAKPSATQMELFKPETRNLKLETPFFLSRHSS
jgi:putative membrane protein insertion efficiency factor